MFYIFLVIILVVVYLFFKNSKRNYRAQSIYKQNKVNLNELKEEHNELAFKDIDKDGFLMISELYPLTEEDVIKKIKDNNSSLNINEFYQYVKSVFLFLTKSYNEMNVNLIRPFCINSLYYKKKYEIEDYDKNDIKRVIRNLKIKGCVLKDYNIDGDNETIVVSVSAKMIDYAIEQSTSNLIFGDMKEAVDNIYILTFLKKKNIYDKKFDFNSNVCPNCGSKLNLGDDGICQYCDTMLVVGDFYWVLTDIKNIKI